MSKERLMQEHDLSDILTRVKFRSPEKDDSEEKKPNMRFTSPLRV